jgi:hypothetical protein
MEIKTIIVAPERIEAVFVSRIKRQGVYRADCPVLAVIEGSSAVSPLIFDEDRGYIPPAEDPLFLGIERDGVAGDWEHAADALEAQREKWVAAMLQHPEGTCLTIVAAVLGIPLWRLIEKITLTGDRQGSPGRRDERFFCGTKQKSVAMAGLNDRDRKKG